MDFRLKINYYRLNVVSEYYTMNFMDFWIEFDYSSKALLYFSSICRKLSRYNINKVIVMYIIWYTRSLARIIIAYWFL